MNGSIQIIDGRFFIKDEKEGGNKAKIYSHPDIILKVDGKEIKDSIEVSSNSKVEAIAKNEKPERIFDVKVQNNGMTAYGVIHYHKGREINILDGAETQELKIQVAYQEVVPKEYIYPEIIEHLKKLKIDFGIIKDAIDDLITDPGKEVLIAQGIEPKTGEDGYIDYYFYSEENEKDLKDVNARVDYKNLTKIPSVKKDQLIAKKTQAIQGENGKDIYSKIIKPPRPKDPDIIPGNNVRLEGSGLRAYSTVDGKPSLKGKVLHVFSVHEVFKDVDIKSGNINFSGDVIIRGNISEGMVVNAGHNITVYGAVSGARVEAGGEIDIKNRVIQSTIIAGASQTELISIYNRLDKIQGLLLKLYQSLVKILEEYTSREIPNISIGKVVVFLLEKHYIGIMTLFKELESIERSKLPVEIDDELYNSMIGLGDKYTIYGALRIENIEEIKEDILHLTKVKEKLYSQFSQPMNITILYAQNSTLKTSGSIIITGQGCLNSNIEAGGGVRTENIGKSLKPCVFRGGRIQCKEDIHLSEIGSTGGAFTEVITGRKGKIIFNSLYYNTHIQIGEGKKKIEASQSRGVCFRNNKGEIIIKTSS